MSDDDTFGPYIVSTILFVLLACMVGGLFIRSESTANEQRSQIASDEATIANLEQQLANAQTRLSVLERRQSTADRLKQDMKTLDGNLEHLQKTLNVETGR